MSPQWSRVLVAIDFSPSSELALTQAARLAKELDARLDLVHVHQPFIVTAPEGLITPSDEGQELLAAQAKLEELRGRFGPALGEVHVRLGPPLEGLLAVVDELRPDLLVVGSHGRGVLMRVLLGSTAEQLCRRSPVPVLVVPAPERAAQRPAEASTPP